LKVISEGGGSLSLKLMVDNNGGLSVNRRKTVEHSSICLYSKKEEWKVDVTVKKRGNKDKERV